MEAAYWWGAVIGALVGAAVGVGGTALYKGAVAAFVAQMKGPRTWTACGGSAMFSVLLSGMALLVFAMEGLVCLPMAAPLIVGLALLGSWLGWLAGGGKTQSGAQLALPSIGVLALAVGGGSILPAPDSSGEVTTVWHLFAPPERLWPHVLALPSLPEPDWWLFRLGVAYPLRSETKPDGARTCDLSTGPMPEIVTRRDEYRRLAFRVIKTPPSMRELNPFGKVHASHLTSVYRGKEGEFLLSPEGSGTLLIARSSYGLRMGPFWYWRLWPDSIVSHVHERVVQEIERRSSFDSIGR
ncbi:hypothetical protein EON82_17565 [bacterium]|nr:MAG: hypothetical protein EON82_17565 [bacterium]